MSFDPNIQGIKNYIADRDGVKIGKWVTYADAAQTNPVDGTGGTPLPPLSTFAVSTDSTMRGVTNFLWTHSAANRQGEGFSYDFSIDPSDKGKVLQCSFEYLISSGTYADNDMSVWIYDVTNAVLIQPAPYLIKNSGIIEKFAIEFQTASNSTSYRLIFHVDTATATAYTIRFTNFNLGPQAKLYGSAVTDWVSYSPNISSPGILSNLGKWRRVGDSMEIEGYVEWNGSGGGGTLLVDIPSGFTIDTNKMSFNPGRFGDAQKLDSGVAYYELSVIYSDSNSVRFMQTSGSAYQSGSDFTSGDQLKFNFKIPIVGWSSSQVFSQDADVRVVAAQVYAATISSTTTGTPLIFPTIGTDTHAGYNSTTGLYTAPVSGYYQVNVEVAAGTFASGNYIYASVNGNTTPGANRPIIAWSLVANGSMSGSGIVFANAGQTISIRATATLTSADPCNLSIYRLTGPSQIAASESVSALYTGAPPTGSLSGSLSNVTFGTKVKDSHNAMSGATYTVPVSGTYSISATVAIIGTRVLGSTDQLNILVNGTSIASNIQNAGGAIGVQYPLSSVLSYPILAGQTVTIQVATSSTTPSYDSVASRAYFSIIRTGNF